MTEPPANDWQSDYAEIATLAGGFAHEIRNPLSTIKLNIDLLVEDLHDAGSTRDRRMATKLERVQRECVHLEQVVNAFLQFARSNLVTAQPTDVTAEVADFLAGFEAEAAAASIELSPHLSADLPPVALDPSLFRQVLTNLFRNARQAMPDGGTIEVATHAEADGVRIEVIDTGCGMTAEQRSRMFEAFYSTKTSDKKDGGTGLGLPTVRKIVEAHGGRIACDSDPGRGTRFVITLPAAE